MDLFSSGPTHPAGRVIEFKALKLLLEMLEADAVDAYCHALESEEAVVELALEYLDRLDRDGKDTKVVWRLRGQLPTGQSWVEHLEGILVDILGLERCKTTPQFYCNNSRLVGYSDSRWTGDPVAEQWPCGRGRMPTGVIFTKTEMRGDEQEHGRMIRDVFDSGGVVAHAVCIGSWNRGRLFSLLMCLCPVQSTRSSFFSHVICAELLFRVKKRATVACFSSIRLLRGMSVSWQQHEISRILSSSGVSPPSGAGGLA